MNREWYIERESGMSGDDWSDAMDAWAEYFKSVGLDQAALAVVLVSENTSHGYIPGQVPDQGRWLWTLDVEVGQEPARELSRLTGEDDPFDIVRQERLRCIDICERHGREHLKNAEAPGLTRHDRQEYINMSWALTCAADDMRDSDA